MHERDFGAIEIEIRHQSLHGVSGPRRTINANQDLEIAFIHKLAADQHCSANVLDNSARYQSKSRTRAVDPPVGADNNDIVVFAQTDEHVAR
jgi:hypothetical protein